MQFIFLKPRYAASLFAIMLLASCSQNLTIKDVVVTDRFISPDSSYLAITYYIDHGAMGESVPMSSILKIPDTTYLPSSSRLPCLNLPFYACYYPAKWTNKRMISVYINERPFVRAGIPLDTASFVINGISCKVIPFDFSYNKSPLIEYFNFSADRKKLIVCYGYEGEKDISAINYGDSLPRIGNVYATTPISFNPIIYAKWNEHKIDMYLKDASMFKTEDYINKKSPFPVSFIDATKLTEPYRANDYGVGVPLYRDNQIDKLLNDSGIAGKAQIVQYNWHKNGDFEYFEYEYEYSVGTNKFRSYFRLPGNPTKGTRYKEGDKIDLIIDPREPIIHKTKDNYNR